MVCVETRELPAGRGHELKSIQMIKVTVVKETDKAMQTILLNVHFERYGWESCLC